MQKSSQPPQNQQYEQPSHQQGHQHFQNSLCGCTKHCSQCLIAYICCCFLQYTHAKAVHKATKGSTSCLMAYCLDCCGCCCLNRKAIRKAYNIEGSLIADCCTLYFCYFCAMLQEQYEVEDRG